VTAVVPAMANRNETGKTAIDSGFGYNKGDMMNKGGMTNV